MMGVDLSLTGSRSRLPGIIQSEASECGLACLAMLSAYHGRHVDLAGLRRRFSVSLKGTTLRALIGIAARMNLMTRPLRLELEHLGQLRLPCILHWNFNHFVVLKAVHRKGVTIHDPAVGERRVDMAELSAAFTGVAMEVWPGTDFTEGDERRRVSLRDLTGPVTGLRRAVALVVLLALALELFSLLSPLFMQWVIDHVLISADTSLLTTLAFGFGLLVLLQHCTSTLRAWLIMHLGTQLAVQWQARVFDHMLRLPLSWFEKRHVGDTASRFRSLEVIRRTLATSFIEAVADGFMTLVTLTVIFIYSPLLSLICCAAVALYGLCRWLTFQPLRTAAREHLVHAARQESHFLETLRGIRPVRLYAREPDRHANWLALVSDQINAGLRGERLQILCGMVNGVVFGLENVFVIWLGALMVLEGELTAGMLIAFIAYKNQFGQRIAALIDRLVELRALRVHTERLADIVMSEREPEGDVVRETDCAPPPASASGEGSERSMTTATGAESGRLRDTAGTTRHDRNEVVIDVRALSFRYGGHEPWIVRDITFSISRGETVAIIGPSGCGKSTLLALLLGLMEPGSGSLRIDGHDARGNRSAQRAAGMAAALQDDLLFAGSIGDNIGFLDPDYDHARVQRSAELAAVHEDISAMPMGYHTFVGHMGSVLSSGQKQRILLARALYSQPRILLMDEATSHLDPERETIVQRNLDGLNMTRIVVAHRPESVAGADRVLVMSGGRIVRTLCRRSDSVGAAAGQPSD